MKQKVTEQVALINQLECDIQCRLKNAINEQHMIELSVCERVISMIQEHILNCEAISTEWLIAKDAMAVCNDRVVYMPPEVDMNYCR